MNEGRVKILRRHSTIRILGWRFQPPGTSWYSRGEIKTRRDGTYRESLETKHLEQKLGNSLVAQNGRDKIEGDSRVLNEGGDVPHHSEVGGGWADGPTLNWKSVQVLGVAKVVTNVTPESSFRRDLIISSNLH